MYWSTKGITDLIATVTGYRPKATYPPGGDHDTECIVYSVSEDLHISVRGFTTFDTVNDSHESGIEMIEVTDGEDSRGGFSGSDLETGILYVRICCALRKEGFYVVPNMEEYF